MSEHEIDGACDYLATRRLRPGPIDPDFLIEDRFGNTTLISSRSPDDDPQWLSDRVPHAACRTPFGDRLHT